MQPTSPARYSPRSTRLPMLRALLEPDPCLSDRLNMRLRTCGLTGVRPPALCESGTALSAREAADSEPRVSAWLSSHQGYIVSQGALETWRTREGATPSACGVRHHRLRDRAPHPRLPAAAGWEPTPVRGPVNDDAPASKEHTDVWAWASCRRRRSPRWRPNRPRRRHRGIHSGRDQPARLPEKPHARDPARLRDALRRHADAAAHSR